MTDLSEIMERVKAWPVGRTLSREDLTALVTEIERQASEIERLAWYEKAASDLSNDVTRMGEEIERLREAFVLCWNWMAECGMALSPQIMERLQELGVIALNEKEPDADA